MMTGRPLHRVLIVSSTDAAYQHLVELLPSDDFFPVFRATSAGEAKRMLVADPVDIIIINSPLSDEFGTELALDLSQGTAGILLALVLALMLECRIPFKSQFRTFFLSPMMVPVASIILVWQVLFHSNGVVNEFLSVFGVKAIDWLKSDYCMVVIVLLFLWKNLGYNMILFMAALNNIPKELLEVAEVEGASKAYQFFHIKLRYLSPTVLFVTILSIINSFKVFREIYLLSGDYPYEGLYMLQHFMNNMYNKNLDYQRLSASAIMLAIVIIALIALLFAIENYFGKDVEG